MDHDRHRHSAFGDVDEEERRSVAVVELRGHRSIQVRRLDDECVRIGAGAKRPPLYRIGVARERREFAETGVGYDLVVAELDRVVDDTICVGDGEDPAREVEDVLRLRSGYDDSASPGSALPVADQGNHRVFVDTRVQWAVDVSGFATVQGRDALVAADDGEAVVVGGVTPPEKRARTFRVRLDEETLKTLNRRNGDGVDTCTAVDAPTFVEFCVDRVDRVEEDSDRWIDVDVDVGHRFALRVSPAARHCAR